MLVNFMKNLNMCVFEVDNKVDEWVSEISKLNNVSSAERDDNMEAI